MQITEYLDLIESCSFQIVGYKDNPNTFDQSDNELDSAIKSISIVAAKKLSNINIYFEPLVLSICGWYFLYWVSRIFKYIKAGTIFITKS